MTRGTPPDGTLQGEEAIVRLLAPLAQGAWRQAQALGRLAEGNALGLCPVEEGSDVATQVMLALTAIELRPWAAPVNGGRRRRWLAEIVQASHVLFLFPGG